MTRPSKSTSNFQVEGLEARILLSAVPLDGGVNPEEGQDEALFADTVLALDTELAEQETAASGSPEEELFAAATPLESAGEVFLSGTVEAGAEIAAEVIHVAEGTILENVALRAEQVHLGAAVWRGDNAIFSDALNILADQQAEPGATLLLTTRDPDADIALGFDQAGFALNGAEIDALAAAAFEELIIGSADGSHDMSIDGLAYHGDLLLRSPQDGGEFYVLSQINHSGGALRFEGSGQTQNINADTITSGNEIRVDDTLQLDYVEGSGNAFGDNTFYFDTTNDGANPGGADILITGDILGTGVGKGGTLYLNAGTTGNILVQGNIGTDAAVERIVVVNANDVTLQGNIILESFEQQNGTGNSSFGATASNFVRTEGGDFIVNTFNNITFGGDVESAFRNFELTVDLFATSGKVWFKGDVNLDNGDLIVHAAKDFEITGSAEIKGALQQSVGARDTIFRASVQAESIDLFAQQRIRFLNTVTLLEGDMTLVADDIDFEGGAATVIGALDADGQPASRLFLRPTAATIAMDIGDPTGGTATFELSGADIAALADGFASITIGYHQSAVTSTNAVRIGNAAFLDSLSVYGGSFLVNGSFSARSSLLLDAASGLVDVTGTQIRVSNEQVDNVWQSAELSLLARTGNIQFRNSASLLIDNDDPADTNQGSTINLTAMLGSIINEANSFGFIEARDLNATAGQSITMLTNVATVSAVSTVAGNIQIDELDQLHVLRGITANGAIAVTSGGDTVVDLLESETDATANSISVKVFGGDLQVDQVLAGATGAVVLDAEGALTGFSQSDRSELLELPRVIMNGGDDGAQASGEWTLQGVTVAINSALFTDALNGSVFRLVASEEPELSPVRVETDGEVSTIYALPGVATHADVVSAIDGLAAFEASISSGTSALLDLPAITLAGGTATPLVAASGSYDFGSTVLKVSALIAGLDANDTRVIFAADGIGVPSAEWDDAAKVLTLHYVPGVTSVGVLRNLINNTTAANLSASLLSGTGTQILDIDSITIDNGAVPATAGGAFAFADGVLTLSGNTSGEGPNGVAVSFVGDGEVGVSSDWNGVDNILTIRYTAGASTLGDLASAVSASTSGLNAAVTSGDPLAVLEIPKTQLNGGREGVPASGNLRVDGVNLRITDTTGLVADNGPDFRLVGAQEDALGTALTMGEPVRILQDGSEWTIYAWAGTATHADVLAAVNALPDFAAAVVDAHVIGDTLTLSAHTGIGQALNPLQTRANAIEAVNSMSGAVHLQQDDARTEVALAIDNQSTAASDYVAVTTLGGNASVSTNTIGSANGDGILSASAAGVSLDIAGSLTIDTNVSSEGGLLTFRAVDAISVSSAVALDSKGGDVFFTSLDNLSLAVDASVLSGGGAIAASVDGDLLAGVLDARGADPADRESWGAVALHAGGFIRDHSASTAVNLFARSLQLKAGNGIGLIPDGLVERTLEVNAASLAASTDSGAIALRSLADLDMGAVAAFNPDVLNRDGSIVTGPTMAAMTGVMNNGGGDVLVSSDAALLASGAVRTMGPGRIVLLAATLTIEDAVTSNGGALSLSASNDLTLGDAANLTTSNEADVLVISDNASILGAAGSTVTAGDGGPILLAAQQNITLGTVTTSGMLGLRASSGSILAASGGDNLRTVLSSDTLAIVADGSVAGANGSTDALRVAVNTLSLSGGAGADHNLSNDRALRIDNTSASVSRFSKLLEASTVSIDAQSNVVVTGAGDISIEVRTGNLTLVGGRKIGTTGAGAITLNVDGAASMGVNSRITNENGAISITAGGKISVARVDSVDGAIAVTSANGAIIDADPASAALDFETAGQLTLNASTGIGIDAGNRQTLTVQLGTLAANTATGGIFVSSANSFATNGLVTANSGTISLISGGTLTLGPNAGGIAVDSAADLVLRAGTNLVQSVDSSIDAAADISLYAGTDMLLFAVDTPGNVALEASGAVMGYADPTLAAITGQGLLLDSVGSLGTPTQRLALDVALLAGTIETGTLAFDNAQSLNLGTVSVSTTETAPMGTLPVDDRVQTGDTLMINSLLDGAGELQGSGLFATLQGELVVDSAGLAAAVSLTKALPVLWQSSGDQNWNGRLLLSGGDATLRAGGAIHFAATAALNSAGGDLSLESDGAFTLAAGASIDLLSGSAVFDSANSITIDGSVMTTGALALKASESISAGIAGGATRLNAANLILNAGQGIGADDSVLTTEVGRLAASAGASGIYLNNSGDLRVTNLGFAVTSFAPDSTANVAFSGFQGGLQTQLSGAIKVNNDGDLVVDPVSAVIRAFPGSAFEFAVVMDEAGPDGNAISLLFEVVRDPSEPIDASEDPMNPDLRDGDPPSTEFNATSGVLRVFVRNELSTMAQIIDAINNDPDFAGSATLANGPADGSTVFTLGTEEEKAFFAGQGSDEGVVTQSAGSTEGGADSIAAYAEIQPGNAVYSIRVTSTEPGAAANDFEFRLLDDGPGGRLADASDEASVVWDRVTGLLDVYINFGHSTAGSIVNAINAAQVAEGLPFTAAFTGLTNASDADDIIGDASVLMVSNLSAEATLRPVGSNNDFRVVSNVSGPLYNGIGFRFIDDGLVAAQGVRAAFDDQANLMSIYIDSATTTADQVVTALNAEGTFTASIVPELNNANNGSGAIQATHFQLRGGAVAVNASVTVGMVGTNNDFVVTADVVGDDENAIQVLLIGDASISAGSALADYDSTGKILEIRINPDFATPGGIIEAINLGPNAASIPLTASLPDGTTGFGGIALASYPLSAGGTGGIARATFNPDGDNNAFELLADSDSVELQNIRAFIIDDGSINDASASATYLSDARHLILNIQTGVTTANTLLAAINGSAVPVSASLAGDSDGTGSFGNQAKSFVNGADAIAANLTTMLPSGVSVELVSTTGGVVNNGIQVSYALDPSLPAGTASATLFEADGLRLLQVRFAETATTLSALQDALDADATLPFTIANIGSIASLPVGELAPVSASGNEGAIRLNANGSVSLFARIFSETGAVSLATTSLATTSAGDLSFDAKTARMVAIDGIDLNLAGAFINAASLESPLLKVYDQSLLRLSTGSLSASSEANRFETNGDLEIDGAGLVLTDADFAAAAGGTAWINGAISTAAPGNITIDSGDTFTLTSSGSLAADAITLLSGNGADLSGSANATNTFTLTADADILQSGTIAATADLALTSDSGAIRMSGAATTSSTSGDILYEASSAIELTSIASTAGGDITLISGAAISNARASLGTNLATSGHVSLSAVSGIGAIGDAIRVESGTLSLSNSGASGDVVVTETTAGAGMTLNALTQSATGGWSVLRTEAGDLNLSGPVLHTDNGALLVESAAAIVSNASASLTLDGGALTLRSVSDVSLGADIATAGGEVYVDAGGALTMASAITLDAGGGDVALRANADIEVAQALSLMAGVHLASANGSIRRAANDGRTNIRAAQLQLQAGAAIGALATVDDALIVEVDRLTASATSGVLVIDSIKDLAIGDTTISVDYVSADRSTDADAWTTHQLRSDAGNAVLRGRGSLTFESITTPTATLQVNGNLLLSADAALTLHGDAALSGGSAQLSSGANFNLNGDLSFSGTGTLLIETVGDFAQAVGSTIVTNDQDAILASTGALSLSRIDAGAGDLALTATGPISRLAAAPATQVLAQSLRLQSGAAIASVADPLVVDVSLLTASANGGIRLDGVGAVEVNRLSVSTDRVSNLGATSVDSTRIEAAQADILSTDGGDVLLQFGGALTLLDGDDNGRAIGTNAGGRIFLGAASLDTSADIRSLNGEITLVIDGAAHWIALPESAPGAGDVSAAALRSQTGDLFVSTGADLLMDDASFIQSISGNIAIEVTGNLTVGSIDAPLGYVHLRSSGAILDGGNAAVDLIADRLQIESGTGAGLLGAATYDPLEIAVNRLSAQITTGSLALSELNALEIGLTSGSVDRLDVNGTASVARDASDAYFGIHSLGGGSATVLAAGSITAMAAPAESPALATIRLTDTGHLLLQASASVAVNGDIEATGGSITLRGTAGLALAVDVRVETMLSGSLTLLSSAGGLTMAAGSTLSAGLGDIVVNTSGALAVAGIETSGRVALTSTAASIIDNEAARINVSAATLRLKANNNIGSASNAFDTQVTTLSARTTNGALYLLEADGLEIGTTEAATVIVGDNGLGLANPVAAQSSVVTGGTAGNVVVKLSAGDLSVLADHVLTAAGEGNILLDAPGQMNLLGTVSSATGSISLLSGAEFSLASAIEVATGGTGQIHLASGGHLLSGTDSRFIASTGNVVLSAAGNLILGGISTEGRAALTSISGHIRAAGSTAFDQEVLASHLLLRAEDPLNGGIGTLALASAESFRTQVGRLAALAGAEGIHLVNAVGLTVGSVVVSTARVNDDGSLQNLPDLSLSDLTTTAASASIVLRTSSGSITLNEGGDLNGASVLAHGAGNVLLDAANNLSANASVRSTSGHITLRAANSLTLASDVSVETASAGTIFVQSTAGAVTMDASAIIRASAASALMEAEGVVTLGMVEGLSVAVQSISETILRASGSATNLTAANLRLQADKGIGAASSALQINVDALAATTRAGALFLNEADGATVAANLSVAVSEVEADASTSPLAAAALSGLTTEVDGAIVLITQAGALEIAAAAPVSAATSGRIRIEAAAELSVNANVSSGSGHLSLLAGNGMSFGPGLAISTGGTADLYLDAGTGALTQLASTTTSAGGNLRLAASGEVTLGSNSATVVSILSGANIVAAAGSVDNVTATRLRLDAGAAIGEGNRHLAIAVADLSARTQAGGIFMSEVDDVTITSVSVATTRVTATAGAATQSDAAQADLHSGGDGDIVLIAQNGSLTLNDGNADDAVVVADGSGSILLTAGNILSVNAGITSGTGEIALRAENDLILAGIQVGTAADISLQSAEGLISMPATATITSVSGVLRLQAAGNVTIGQLSAATVSLISDSAALISAEFSTMNVTANALRAIAANAIGTADRHLRTSVDQFSAHAATGGIFITEASDLTVTSVRSVLTEPTATGGATTVSDAAQSDLTAGGAIILVLQSGDLTLEDGDALVDQTAGDARVADGIAVQAGGTGGLLLQVLDGNLFANASILAGSGHLTLRASGSFSVDGSSSIATGGAGHLSVEAEQGALTFAPTASVSGAASVRLAAGTNLTVGAVSGASVALSASFGAILNAPATGTEVNASTALRLAAGQSVGEAANHLRTNAAVLSARSTAGDLFLTNSSSTSVSSVRVETTEFTASAGTSSRVDAAQSDLVTLNNGDIILVLTAGDLTLNDGSGTVTQTGGDARSADGRVVVAHGSGRVHLQAAGSVDVNADLRSTSGWLTLLAGNHLNLAAGVNVTSAADISLRSTAGALTMHGSSVVAASTSTLRLATGDALTVGNLSAASVSLLAAANIVNAVGSSLNVSANSLRIAAEGAIGTADRHLTSNVATLAASAQNGGLFITDQTAVLVASLAVTVNELTARASGSSVSDGALNHLTALNNGALVLHTLAGGIEVPDVTALGTGPVVLSAADSLLLTGVLNAGSGALTLRAANQITFGLAASLSTSTSGSVFIEALGGAFTMSGDATITVANAGVRIYAGGPITMGEMTADRVSLISENGGLRRAAVAGTSVTANQLRIDAAGSVGTLERRFTADAGLLAIEAASVHLWAINGTTLGSVALDFKRLLPDLDSLNVSDDARSGVVSTSGGRIDLRTLGGDLHLSASSGAVSADTSGNILLTVDGDLTAEAAISSLSGTITLLVSGAGSLDAAISSSGDVAISTGTAWTMTGSATVAGALVAIDAGADLTLGNVSGTTVNLDSAASVLSAAGSTRNVLATTAASIVARDGLGATGANANLTIESPVLTVENQIAGSAFFLIFGSTRIDQLDLNNAGSLHLTLSGGDLDLANGLMLGTGAATLRVSGALQLGGGILASGDIRLTAQSLSVDAGLALVEPLIESLERSIELRAPGDVSLPASAILRASLGEIKMTVGGDLSLPVLEAAGLIAIRAQGNISAAGIGAANHLLTADAIRLQSGGYLGTTGQAIVTQTTRLDAQASGSAEVVERDDLEVGRYGLRLTNPASGDSFVLILDDATAASLSSATGEVEVDGDFILRSDGTVTLQTRLINAEGNLFLEIGGLRFALAGAEPVLVAANGHLDLDVGAAGLGAGLSLNAAQLSALIASGNFAALVEGDTEVTPDGLVLLDASGTVTLTVNNGSLTLGGAIVGQGGIQLDILDGGLSTTASLADIAALQAGNSGIELDLYSGATGAGGNAVVTESLEFSAITDEGNLNFEFRPSGSNVVTSLVNHGLTIRSGGVGNISLLSSGHNLDVYGNIENAGFGSVSVNVVAGEFKMFPTSSILVNNGSLNLAASDLIVVNYIENLSGPTSISSAEGLIVRNTEIGTSFVNFRGATGPIISLNNSINLVLDTDSARVNGIDFNRGADQYLFISGSFQQ